ncbi:MAG TPA: shikimate dehydrogenase [Dehalococcoidia bacterium]|jgi:shikimate dehydrogenase
MPPALLGLIGDPVGHSISPSFQQAALDALGIEALYERWQTPPERLAERVAALRRAPYLGANVTVPHKEAVAALLDEVDHTARRVGAVNTIRRDGDRLLGANTDVAGFRRALREAGGFEACGRHVLVLGAGGAARAVILALEQEGAAAVTVANRHAARAERLVQELRSDAAPDLVTVPWTEAVSAAGLRGIDLLVHCTTLGMAGSAGADSSPVAAEALHERLFVCDIVANPLQTPLIAAAQAAGVRALGGLPMLVYQGAAAFTLWTGAAAPVDVMLAAAERAMAGPAPIQQ